jgi:EAL domain-containing protein (putative c-di-GMP-specific phosphodiesterase class I)
MTHTLTNAGVETFSGLFFSQPVEVEWIETSLERPTDPKVN